MICGGTSNLDLSCLLNRQRPKKAKTKPQPHDCVHLQMKMTCSASKWVEMQRAIYNVCDTGWGGVGAGGLTKQNQTNICFVFGRQNLALQWTT